MHDVVDGLGGYRVADLHPVVCEAFADYVVPMRPDEARLTELLIRRGWHPAWSAGLFQGGRLAGFWLTGRESTRTNKTASRPPAPADQPVQAGGVSLVHRAW